MARSAKHHRPSPRSRCLGASLGLGLVLSSTASPAQILTEADLLGSIPAPTTATRMAQSSAHSPAAVTLIDHAQIEASGAQRLVDVLRLVPGFQAYHVNGHKFGVTTHGMGNPLPGRMEVLMDGRSVYLAGFSSVDWQALGIGLADIERIEVVRAPSAASWGANAFQGVINLITRNPVTQSGSQAEAILGDNRHRSLSASTSNTLDAGSFRLSGGYREDEGFTQEDEGQSRYLNLRTLWTPNLEDQWDLHLGIAKARGGVGDAGVPLAERQTLSHFQSLTWRHSGDNQRETQMRLYHNFLRYDMEQRLLSQLSGLSPQRLAAMGVPDEPLPANFEAGSTRRVDWELQHQRPLAPGIRALWGLGLRWEYGDAPLLLNRNDPLSETFWRGFTNLEWRSSPRWTWNLGALVEHNDLVGTKASPRLALNHQLHPGHTLRLGYSLAHRTPSLLEVFQDSRLEHSNGRLLFWLRNSADSLRAEENKTLEIGYLFQPPELGMSLDLRLYRESIDDAIFQVRRPIKRRPLPLLDPSGLGRVTNINNSTWTSYGLETELSWRPNLLTRLRLIYAYQDIEGGMRGPGALDPDFEDNGPRHNLALLVSRTLGQGYEFSGAFYHQSANQWLNGNRTAGYNRLDLRLAKKFRIQGQRAQWSLIAQNLGNSYAEFQDRNTFDTRLFLSLEVKIR